jgi:2-polyprenyl-6-methoxyphenol hydroxylase-like FAD-dependent oxidoreductase
MRDTDVLIVGAGPTGLVLALWLTLLGRAVRVVDKTAEAGTTSRALAVQARTLEFYRQIGLADAVVERGRKVLAANLWVTGHKVARAVFGEMGAGLSPFPYAQIFPQDEHERLLIERLAEAGVGIERATELLDFEDATGRLRAHLKRADGTWRRARPPTLQDATARIPACARRSRLGSPAGRTPTSSMSLTCKRAEP